MDGAIAFLKGDSRDIIADLRVKMEKAAEELDFEQAAKLRDRINSIERIKEKQKVVYKSVEEQDVFATADIDGSVCLAVLRFSNGRLLTVSISSSMTPVIRRVCVPISSRPIILCGTIFRSALL